MISIEEWLDGNRLSIDIWNKKYRHNNETFEKWLGRVSNNNDDIKNLILQKKFIFGGRILANRGISEGSLANCATLGRVEDNIEDIMNVTKKLAITFKAQQGQGLSLTNIRPKDTLIGNKYPSEGIIPFMELFNTTTQAIQQGGHRRGALLMSLDIWHKEAENFIKIKSDLNKITNANLSLEIDDDFMKCVQKYYETGENTIKHVKKSYEGNEIEYDVNVIELYRVLCKHARDYAEPGILFTDKLFDYNLMQYCNNYTIECTNACSEQPLKKHGMCMLSSFNLSEYVVYPYTPEAYFDVESFEADIPIVIGAMDDIVDENIPLSPLKEQKEVARTFRNIGIGIMGLGDCLIKLGSIYGSMEAVTFTNYIMRKMFRVAIEADVQLACERGSFPGYNPEIWNSDIIKEAFTEEEIVRYKNIGKLRNCSLLSVAPTGSIGTMFSCSTGVEPNFALSYNRRTVSLGDNVYRVNIKPVDEYFNMYPDKEKLPDCFITAADINWKNRINMQAALQRFCDTAISSTCNLKEDTSAEEVEQIYLYAWKQGCKGFTIYRDGSRLPILSTDNITDKSKYVKRPKKLPADFYSIKANGEKFYVFVGLYDNKPYEIFIMPNNTTITVPNHIGTIEKIGKAHYKYDSDEVTIDNIAMEEQDYKNITLNVSLALRHNIPIKYIIHTVKKANSNITSVNSAICRILNKYAPNETDKCPECGGELVNEGGCSHCNSCGYSKCMLTKKLE